MSTGDKLSCINQKVHYVHSSTLALLEGEGIGEKLLRNLIEHAKAECLDAIEAVVLRTNGAMIHVAEKSGFSCVYDEEENVVRQYLNLNDSIT